MFDDPHAALKTLTQKNNFLQDTSALATFVNPNEYDDENPLKKIDYSKLSNFIYQKDRFNDISIAIVDYSMPKMNGVEFCKKISNSRVKKIMLTGNAGYEIGIQSSAFPGVEMIHAKMMQFQQPLAKRKKRSDKKRSDRKRK